MALFTINNLSRLFSLSCVGVTIAMVTFWVYEFFDDKDLCLVDYKDYSDNARGNTYPTASLCLNEPISTEKLKVHNATFTDEMYAKYLWGEIYDDNLAKLDFDNVTYPLLDYIEEIHQVLKNGTILKITDVGAAKPHTFSTFSNGGYFVGRMSKCIALEMDPANFDMVYFVFKKTIFPDGIRPNVWGSKLLPIVTFQLFPATNYPWQFKKYAWPKHQDPTSEYEMYFTITNVEILKRRSKSDAPCIEDWKMYGNNVENIFQSVMDEVGCRAPYQQSMKPMALCQTKEKMREMYTLLHADPTKKYLPTCDTLENMQYAYHDAIFKNNIKGPEWFWIGIDMPDRYKEIVQIRAVDIQSLIGNCGGYIGLFLGECSVSYS